MPTIEELQKLSEEGFGPVINPDGSVRAGLAELEEKMQKRLAELRNNEAFMEKLGEDLNRVSSAAVNAPPIELGPSVVWTLKAKMGEIVENAHGLKDGSLVIRQENVLEIVTACIEADRRERGDSLPTTLTQT